MNFLSKKHYRSKPGHNHNIPVKQNKVQTKMEENLLGSKFRILNEKLYTIPSEEAFSYFNENPEEILNLYDKYSAEAQALMEKKNHDYGEAWRDMRISSITDLIYQKVLRTKQIEDNHGKTLVSEGLDANYFDMLNYAVFCLIKFSEQTIASEPKN